MTIVTMPNSIDGLSKRLKKIDKKLGQDIKNYLPDWWDEELVSSPGATQQALICIAKFTSLDINSVLNSNQELRFKESNCRYKHANNKEQSELAAATALVQSLANTAALITVNKYCSFQDALSIRNDFFSAGKSWVDFKSLVNYCWEQGTPVLYLPKLPVSKKMDAVVVDVNGRPVICLTKKHKHESELLFLLAHEMGHIFYRHLEQGQTLVDTVVNKPNEKDEQEKQANSFAIELLTGSENTSYHSNGKPLKGTELAKAAEQKSIECKVDPGHIALNWGHTTEYWGSAKTALNILYPAPDWEEYIKLKLCENIDKDATNEDSLDYLYKLMNIEE